MHFIFFSLFHFIILCFPIVTGTTGNHPEGTSLTNNFFHELGLHEKQSSAWFQAKSASTFWKHNIFFNGYTHSVSVSVIVSVSVCLSFFHLSYLYLCVLSPRAGVNVNDGFGGNNTFVESLMFNSCRESQDHGYTAIRLNLHILRIMLIFVIILSCISLGLVLSIRGIASHSSPLFVTVHLTHSSF